MGKPLILPWMHKKLDVADQLWLVPACYMAAFLFLDTIAPQAAVWCILAFTLFIHTILNAVCFGYCVGYNVGRYKHYKLFYLALVMMTTAGTLICGGVFTYFLIWHIGWH